MRPTLPSMDPVDDVVLLRPETEHVPEDSVHAAVVNRLVNGLTSRYRTRGDVVVCDRLGWFPDASDTRIRLDPDVMVVFGRPPGRRTSYKQWAEDGVPPRVIIEVRSSKDGDADYERRFARARQYGVEVAVLVAPFAPGGVRVDVLRPDPTDPDRFVTTATSVSRDDPLTVPELGIELAGGPRLMAGDEHAQWPEPGEAIVQAREATARADAEAARAAAESARAERLAAKLRELGVDPSTI